MGLETVLIGTAVGLTGASLIESNNARKDSRRAQRANQRIEARKMQREKQAQLRAAQRETAKMTAASVSQGTGESSAVSGGVSSINQQTANNIGFIESMNRAQLDIQRRLEKASQHQFNAQAFSSLASIASMGVGMGNTPAPNKTPAPVETSVGVPTGN